MTRRVGVFGGSFDPVHEAHLMVARRALDQASLDEVWLLPARRAPHKLRQAHASGVHRRKMLELVAADDPTLVVCDHELTRPAGRRSVETLEELDCLHPDVGFSFLMGEDSFRALDSWCAPERLAELAPFIVQPRPPVSELRPAEFGGVPVLWLVGEPVDLSATCIRSEIARGGRPSQLLKSVADYIVEHELYRDAIDPATEGEAQ
jgi:nicotinate-nucleotide adenylyltransferase